MPKLEEGQDVYVYQVDEDSGREVRCPGVIKTLTPLYATVIWSSGEREVDKHHGRFRRATQRVGTAQCESTWFETPEQYEKRSDTVAWAVRSLAAHGLHVDEQHSPGDYALIALAQFLEDYQQEPSPGLNTVTEQLHAVILLSRDALDATLSPPQEGARFLRMWAASADREDPGAAAQLRAAAVFVESVPQLDEQTAERAYLAARSVALSALRDLYRLRMLPETA